MISKDELFERETKNLLCSIGAENLKQLFSYKECELDYSYVTNVQIYAD